MPRVNLKARPHEVIQDVWFGDKLGPFVFTAGEAADLLSSYLIEDEDASAIAQVRAKYDWVQAGFAEEDWAEIQDALDDPTDPLQSRHILEMYGVLIEEVGKVPPTSPPSSSRTRPRSTGGAKPRPKRSTSGA